MYNKIGHLIWVWLTTAVFAGFIFYISREPNFSIYGDATDEALKVLFRMIMYGILFILLYRSMIASLRNTVRRLSGWHTRREAVEDAQFALIIETLLVVLCILACIIFAVFEELSQNYVTGRNIYPGDAERDILVSTMAVLLSALIVYSIPALGELEVALKHRINEEWKSLGARRKKSE